MQKRTLSYLLAAFLLLPLAVLLSGCGDRPATDVPPDAYKTYPGGGKARPAGAPQKNGQ